MRPTLILQPIHNSSADILKKFATGKPLSAEQQHFLDWHQKQLSNGWYDPILRYYLSTKRNKNIAHPSFLLAHEEMNFESIKQLKERIRLSLQEKAHPVICLTQKQYLQFRECTLRDLIFWHGNQFLTGASFYPSGTPPMIFFQWGNLFGIVKYIVLSGEKSLKHNLLIYFEDRQERDLEQCVNEYQHRLAEDIKKQNELTLEKVDHEIITHTLTPKLTPSHYFLADHL